MVHGYGTIMIFGGSALWRANEVTTMSHFFQFVKSELWITHSSVNI